MQESLSALGQRGRGLAQRREGGVDGGATWLGGPPHPALSLSAGSGGASLQRRVSASVQPLVVAQPRNVGVGEPNRKVGRHVVVTPAEHLAVPVNPCQGLAVG